MIGSVVIPAFNRPRRLLRAIDSVLAQSFRDFELVAVDDASTDDLAEAKQRVESAGHRWIRLERNSGPQVARNVGVAATAGEWITFLDSDDVWLPEKLERQWDWHQAHPGIRISQCREDWLRHGQTVRKPTHWEQPGTGRIFEACVKRCCISCTCVMLSRDLWDEVGGFDERYWTCEDYELWLRIALENEVGLVPEVLAEKHGGHPDQMSFSFRAADRWRVSALIQLFGSGLPEPERDVVTRAIGEKAGILRQGAEKRQASAERIYRDIEAWALADDARPFPPELADALRESCFSEGNPQWPAPDVSRTR